MTKLVIILNYKLFQFRYERVSIANIDLSEARRPVGLNHIILTIPYNGMSKSVVSISKADLKSKLFNNTKYHVIRTNNSTFYFRLKLKYNSITTPTWQINLSHSNVGPIDTSDK